MSITDKITSHPLFKYYLYSLLAHVFLVILALGLTYFFSFKSKPHRVVWITLPQGIGHDIEAIKKAENLPRSTIQEQKKAIDLPPDVPEKEAPKQKENLTPPQEKPEPKPEEPKVVEAPKPEEPKAEAPKPKAPVEKPKPIPKAPVSELDKKIQAALNKNKDTTSQRVPIEASQVPDAGKGAGSVTADQNAQMDDPVFAQYYALIRERINREWITAPKLFTESEDLKAQLVVMIGEDGTVTSIEFETSSGNYSFDLSAKRAVERASPLPSPPATLKDEVVDEGFLIEFSPTKVER